MNNNTIVLHCAAFAAPYAGNFIRSLCALEEKLLPHGMKMAYVFLPSAKLQSWWEDFSSKHLVYCTESDSEVGKSKELSAIINELDPAIIHTHFEGYDVPVAMAVKRSHSKAHIIWHMHDVLAYHQNPLKRLYQYFCFFRHYCFYGKGVSAIGVSKQILDFTSWYRTIFFGKFRKAEVIPNGVDLSRITINDLYQIHKPFTFLVYGGRNIQKRFDLVINAASKLAKDFSFRLLITRGTDTDSVIKGLFPLQIPSWCQVISPKDNVSEVLSLCDCFVSCSIAEGHSYALCEATMFGLPVIQSDIPGNAWNSKSPSSYVFKSEDIDDLAAAMEKVMSEDPAILSNRIKETQRINIKEYSLDAWCGKIINFYEEILSLH